MQDERRELNLAIVVGTGRRRGMPDLQSSSDGDGEMPAGRREFESGDTTFEGEVMNDNFATEVGQDGAAILVNGEQKTALRAQI